MIIANIPKVVEMVVVVVEVVVEVVVGVSEGKEYMVINRDNQMYSNANNQANNNN